MKLGTRTWRVERAGQVVQLEVQPAVRLEGEARIAYVDVAVGKKAPTVLVRYGFVEGIEAGFTRTWEMSVMAGCAGVAGSATIGAHCTIGGGAIVLGHLTLADNVHISAASVVMRSIGKPGQYSGVFPIDDNAAWEKNAATLRQLHGLRERLRALEKKTP